MILKLMWLCWFYPKYIETQVKSHGNSLLVLLCLWLLVSAGIKEGPILKRLPYLSLQYLSTVQVPAGATGSKSLWRRFSGSLACAYLNQGQLNEHQHSCGHGWGRTWLSAVCCPCICCQEELVLIASYQSLIQETGHMPTSQQLLFSMN